MRSSLTVFAWFVSVCCVCCAAADDPVVQDPPVEEEIGDAKGDSAESDAAPGQLRVAQLNPYYAGRFTPVGTAGASCTRTTDCSGSSMTACASATSADGCFECIDKKCRARTWDTAEHAARLFDAVNIDVVGIQELPPTFAPRIDTIIEQATGSPWDFRSSEQGVNGKGSGVGVYWRTDKVELVEDLGYVDVDTLESGYIVRFHGVVLATKGSSTKRLAFFSGKLVWLSDEGAARKAEAQRLRAWMDTKLAPYGDVARIVASDFNDVLGSDAYDVFGDYDDGSATKGTSPGQSPTRRIDYLFWADTPGGATRDGFVTKRSDGRLGRSEFFGSDHRFVYGDALIP